MADCDHTPKTGQRVCSFCPVFTGKFTGTCLNNASSFKMCVLSKIEKGVKTIRFNIKHPEVLFQATLGNEKGQSQSTPPPF